MTTINLSNLFEIQRKLDAEIERKHPSVDGEDRLAKRILALQVELGECANEWRGFKFWSVNQSPRSLRSKCPKHEAEYFFCGVGHEEYSPEEINDKDDYCSIHETYLMPMKKRDPLLEEYVDCLHFILSIGLAKSYELIDFAKEQKECLEVGVDYKADTVTQQFINTFYHLSFFEDHKAKEEYIELTLTFLALGEMLGFAWPRIESAYMSKNAINHKRQEEGY